MRGLVRSLARIRAVAFKEVLHLRRDRLTGGLIAGIPIMMTLLFGYAINQDVRHLTGAVADLSQTSLSRRLIADAQATQVVDFVHAVSSARALEDLLRSGDISIGLFIPADFETRDSSPDRPTAQLLVDGSDPNLLAAARGLLGLPLAITRVVPNPSASIRNPAQPATFELRAYYNPERRSAVFIVPGLCGVILTLTMVLFTATAIVRERELGNLEMLIATPVRTPELMIGKILPYIAIGYLQVGLVLILGVFLFEVPIRGELGQFFAGAGLFVVASLGLGLLISTLASTQFQAFQMTYVTFLPQLLLSGFMFPFDGMPRIAQMFAEIFPLTHFLRIARGILLRGAELDQMTSDLWALSAITFVVMGLAMMRFSKRLD